MNCRKLTNLNPKKIEAHGAIGDAQIKEDQAKKIYQLARELNNAVPLECEYPRVWISSRVWISLSIS